MDRAIRIADTYAVADGAEGGADPDVQRSLELRFAIEVHGAGTLSEESSSARRLAVARGTSELMREESPDGT
jgi:hypothetical protein